LMLLLLRLLVTRKFHIIQFSPFYTYFLHSAFRFSRIAVLSHLEVASFS